VNSPDLLLDVREVSRRFGGLQALDGVSFDVRRGEILALIGPNGAGKSTMLNVISGAISADRGEVRFKGERIDTLPPEQVNLRGLVRTFQGAEILRSLSVRENVMAAGVAHSRSGVLDGLVGLGRATRVTHQLREDAFRQLQVVGLGHLAEAPAAQLTAGQQRLLAVARALATGAELLILDEPGAGLNTVEKNLLVEIILRIRERGTTVVFVEHDLGFVGRLAERMVVLDHGRVIARGLPADVRANAAVVEAYLGNTDVAETARQPAVASIARQLLGIEKLSVRYDGLTALDQVSLDVRQGEIVALIGANGAGKSTLLKAIAGAEPLAGGALRFAGAELAGVGMEARAGLGISMAPEGRALFSALSVRDNLLVGRYAQVRKAGLRNLLWPFGKAAADMAQVLDEVLQFFPRLKERLDQQAGTLSGGEGQMLAIGRALMNGPKLLMLDEPSFGLAPQVSREILESLPRLTERGVTVLMVEQNARSALQVADRAYVLVNGRVVAQGTSRELLDRPDITQAYLGWDGHDTARRQEPGTPATAPAVAVAA
jgi:branched-chain amino acid transport system ATP-binding protein